MVVVISDSPNLSDVLSVFFDEGETEDRRLSFRHDGEYDCDSDDEGRTAHGRIAESNTFDTENVLRRTQSLGAVCSCSGKPILLCRNCMLGDISDRLRDIGYNSALCTSKWRRSLDILNFRAEFEMARASPGYNSLVARLPETFVGKSEKLCSLVKIVCAAAKKCMKNNKMHLGPWRKHKYMQSKWQGTCQRMPSAAPLLHGAEKVSDRRLKQRTSMLTLDLHQTADEVV